MQIPAKLQRNLTKEKATDWLRELPERIANLASRWDLKLQDAYPNCGVAYVAPATQQGRPVVLKVQWPHPECEHEALALQCWNGQGAVQLLTTAPEQQALLLEQCSPGEHLSSVKVDDPMEVMAGLLTQLCIPASGPFQTLTDEALGWQSRLYKRWHASGQGCDKLLVDSAYGLIDDLVHSQGERVLVHQDLHGENVLSAGDAKWLAIDPKPLLGERAFALAPIVRSLEFGASRADLMQRLDRLTEALSVDRQRARDWAAVQAIAWSFGSENAAAQQQTARWLLDR